MRILVHLDADEDFAEMLARRFSDVEARVVADYESLPAVLDEFRPRVFYGVRFRGAGAYPREAIVNCPSLEWIAVGGSGTDHLAPWDAQQVTVTNSAGVAGDVMAQYVCGTLLALSLGLPRFIRQQARGQWRGHLVGDIAGKTALILGLGGTGRAVAKRLNALGLTVLGVRTRAEPVAGVARLYPPEQMDEALSQADVLVLCLPLTGKTRGLIGAKALGRVRPGAYVIDVSRGGILDAGALLAALDEGRLAGAALDVFATEPLPPESPLWRREDVIVTPHSSAVFEGWQRRSFEMFLDNLARFRAGEPLANVVDPVRGY